MPEFILDTNVVFSGLGPHPQSPPVVLLDRALAHSDPRLLLSPALLAEYRRTLTRPAALERNETTLANVEAVLALMRNQGRLLDPPPGPPCPDPRDQHLWDLLAAAPDAILVTGEHQLLRSQEFAGRIRSPREFVERYLPEAADPEQENQ